MTGVEDVHAVFHGPEVRAKLFQHGGSQAVRLPKAYRFEGAEVTVRREGRAVILEPVDHSRPGSAAEWAAFWSGLDALGGDDFPDRDQPIAEDRNLGW